MADDLPSANVASLVSAFYERHPYPPPLDDLQGYRERWDDRRRRADAHLFWPSEPYRDDRSILVAGCGTTQAAKYALRWPNARVTGIDISASSIAFTQKLKQTYRLENLQVRQLPVERAAELGEAFDHVVCTGVLHHLADPDAGLRALREVLSPTGALHLMVYAPYGRAGVYLLQDYCRRLGIRPTASEIGDLVASLASLPPDHPLAPLLRSSPDFREPAGMADALLHPQDRVLFGPPAAAVPARRRPDLRALGAPGALPSAMRRAGALAAPLAAGSAGARRAVCGRRALPRDHGPPQPGRSAQRPAGVGPGFRGRRLARLRPGANAGHDLGSRTAAARRGGRADQPRPHLHRSLPAHRLRAGRPAGLRRRPAYDRRDDRRTDGKSRRGA